MGDFDPNFSTKTRYHYLPKEEVYTYKLAYAKFFSLSVLYREIATFTYDYDSHVRDPKTLPNDRGVTTLLGKSLVENYHLRERGK